MLSGGSPLEKLSDAGVNNSRESCRFSRSKIEQLPDIIPKTKNPRDRTAGTPLPCLATNQLPRRRIGG